jgi:hypothetical protein
MQLERKDLEVRQLVQRSLTQPPTYLGRHAVGVLVLHQDILRNDPQELLHALFILYDRLIEVFGIEDDCRIRLVEGNVELYLTLYSALCAGSGTPTMRRIGMRRL